MKTTAYITAALMAATLAMPALAENCPTKLHKGPDGKIMRMHGHGEGAHGYRPVPMNEATRALEEAMARMHADMQTPYTGDADRDFLRGMIPHHEGAVAMAKVVLKYGEDGQVRRMARDIIRTQEYEIKVMKRWLERMDEEARTEPHPHHRR